MLASTSDLSSLTTAVTTAGLAGPLESAKQVTIFAPTNKAFEAISNVVADLSAEQLTAVLGYHVVEGAVVYNSDITDEVDAETLQGEELRITVRGDEIYVNQARVLQPNVLVKNGVVHVIDRYVHVMSHGTSSSLPVYIGGFKAKGVCVWNIAKIEFPVSSSPRTSRPVVITRPQP